MWTGLGIIAIVILLLYWRGPNPVWGVATAGALIGVVVALFAGFRWYIVWRAIVVATIVGIVLEGVNLLVNKLAAYLHKRQDQA